MTLDAYGPLLSARELAAIWKVTPSAFYKLAKQGAFDLFVVTPAIGPRKYSKHLIEKYLSGEHLVPVRAFGRKRA